MRLATRGNKHKRMDVRVRHTSGSLRYVGKVEFVCSALRNRPDGRRKSLACKALRTTARQIVMGYRRRWAVELFHKKVKHHLGFEDGATHGFDAVIWLPTYCPRANPMERAFGGVHDKCTRNHKRKRLRDLVKDGEPHVQAHGPWQYKLSQLYDDPEVTAAVENIAAKQQPKRAA